MQNLEKIYFKEFSSWINPDEDNLPCDGDLVSGENPIHGFSFRNADLAFYPKYQVQFAKNINLYLYDFIKENWYHCRSGPGTLDLDSFQRRKININKLKKFTVKTSIENMSTFHQCNRYTAARMLKMANNCPDNIHCLSIMFNQWSFAAIGETYPLTPWDEDSGFRENNFYSEYSVDIINNHFKNIKMIKGLN